MFSMNTLQGKIVLVTGASSGIGRATAIQCAQAGASVILCARTKEKLEQLETEIKKVVPNASTYIMPLDVRDRAQVQSAITTLPAGFASVDILVNSAGLARGKEAFQDGDIADWEEMIDTNIKGLMYMTKAVVDGMCKRNSGMIINVGSIAGREIYPRGNVYCATKAAVRMLSDGLRIDLVEHNIRVCTIEPGKVETNFSNVRYHGDTEQAKKEYVGYTPLSADDVAEAILFVVTRPSHVEIGTISIQPTAQAAATIIHKK